MTMSAKNILKVAAIAVIAVAAAKRAPVISQFV